MEGDLCKFWRSKVDVTLHIVSIKVTTVSDWPSRVCVFRPHQDIRPGFGRSRTGGTDHQGTGGNGRIHGWVTRDLVRAGGASPFRSSCPAPSRLSSSAGGGEKRALHLQPRLVGAGLPPVRDDRGPVSLPAAQEEDQEGGSGAAGEGGGWGIFQQVLGGRQVHLQIGGWALERPRSAPLRINANGGS